MVTADANQAWSIQQALEVAPRFEEFRLAWLEEPIRADRPWHEWQALRAGIELPLAAGENISSRAGFAQVLCDDVLQVVQPDVAKWGGVTAEFDVARAIGAAGKTYCPHYLGGGIGLLASAHLLAGVGGDGMLEVDEVQSAAELVFAVQSWPFAEANVATDGSPAYGIDPRLLQRGDLSDCLIACRPF